MALHWHYPSNYYSNQINSFDNQFQSQFQVDETEFLCFDPLSSPLPTFDDPPPFDYHHEFITPTNSCIDFPLPMHLPPEDYVSWDDNYSAQFLPFHKKQKITQFPCFSNDEVFAEFFETPETEVDYDGDYLSRGQKVMMMEEQFGHHDTYQYYYECGNDVINGGNEDTIGKMNKVSAQSKAARERRRKIKEKTVELGKLIPGSSKMNTAEMFQAGIKYVKFLQAQLGILQSIKTLQKDNEKEVVVQTKWNNLPIVTSQLVQEKLYARDKCLVPLHVIPMLQEHCDLQTLPSISHQINEILQ